jgi:predicted amidohydrolase
VKVAAIQFSPLFKDWKSNILRAGSLVQSAVGAGARLVVLPELMTSGYSFMSKAEARTCAEILTDDPDVLKLDGLERPNSMQVMRTMARALNVAIAWGLVEEDFDTGHLHNAQVLALPSGEWVSYRKVNPWGNDYLWAKKGEDSPPIVEYLGKKVGLLICRDVRDQGNGFKEFYEPGDADVVCFSSNWGDGGFPSTNWVEFAEENKCWLVVANRYGQEAHNNFGDGGVCVVSPEGEVHCEGLRWNQPCVVFADI